MMLSRVWTISVLSAAAAAAFAQADPATIQRIVDEGKNRNKVMEHLRYLTKNIGPRLTGSPQLDRAAEWTMQKFREFGLTNVKLEQWGEWPVGFDRGKRQVGKMVEPYEKNFEFTTAAWSPGTNGPKRGPAVMMPKTMEEFERVRAKLRGAWVVTPPPPPFVRGQPPTPPSEDQAKVAELVAKAGILGRVTPSRGDLVLTGGRSNIKWEELPKEVRISIRRKDGESIQYWLDKGREVVLEFDIQQRFIKGPIPLSNVVAEIPGTEKPDEVVIVSGHLDSWNGPGSEGAQDDGTGTMVALEAARILMAAGAKPKRTIRFIMWTGEEQGLLGSRAYVEKHKDELPKISAVFVDDGGTNYEGGASVTKEMEPMMREAIAPAIAAFPDMPMQLQIVERIPRGGGSDHAPFNAAGVPGFFWFETGKADYNYIHHTQYDTLEMVVPEYLVQSSTNAAATSYIIASAPTLLPREKPASPPPSGGG